MVIKGIFHHNSQTTTNHNHWLSRNSRQYNPKWNNNLMKYYNSNFLSILQMLFAFWIETQ